MSTNLKEGDETRRKILLGAKSEFAERGFGGARMGSISLKAGVNQALLHYYFKSKENIYRIIIQNMVEDISKIYGETVINEVNSWNAAPDIKLCAAIYVLVCSELYVRDEDFHRIMAHEIAESNGIIHEFIKEYLIPQLLSLEEILIDGVEAGIFETLDTALLSINIISFIRDLAHGESFFRNTSMYDRIYGNKQETLYNFMLEFSFKSLRPAGKPLVIPVLDDNRKNKLNSILKEMRDDTKNF